MYLWVSPSPLNGKLLALLNCTGPLWVVSTDFQRSLAEFDTQTTGADGPVNQVEWCGNDAIPATWHNLAHLVGHFPVSHWRIEFLAEKREVRV